MADEKQQDEMDKNNQIRDALKRHRGGEHLAAYELYDLLGGKWEPTADGGFRPWEQLDDLISKWEQELEASGRLASSEPDAQQRLASEIYKETFEKQLGKLELDLQEAAELAERRQEGRRGLLGRKHDARRGNRFSWSRSKRSSAYGKVQPRCHSVFNVLFP